MFTGHQNKILLQSEIVQVNRAIEFLCSVPSTAYVIDQERREQEMRRDFLMFQLKQLETSIDSQICI